MIFLLCKYQIKFWSRSLIYIKKKDKDKEGWDEEKDDDEWKRERERDREEKEQELSNLFVVPISNKVLK